MRPDASTSKVPLERQLCIDASDLDSNPFLVSKDQGKNYNRQYANLYFMRLHRLKSRAKDKASRKWESIPNAAFLNRVLDVDQGQMCWVVGTIYLEMKLKPDVIQELAKEHNLVPPPPLAKIYSEDDAVTLEDESGRVKLVGSHIENRKWTFVTGVIAAVLGVETPLGDFEVIDMCFAGMPAQPDTPALPDQDKDKWVAVVSGMELGGHADIDDLKADLLAEYLSGELGDDGIQQESARISHLILAGNSMRQPTRAVLDVPKKKKYGYDSSTYSAKPTAALNRFLVNVLPSMNVTIMPGERDPTVPTMPQQPIHKALLANAVPFGNALQCTTNPCNLTLYDRLFLGTSGQTLDDIYKYLEEDNRLEMLSSTLDWSHIAPTAPDTLWCYPFSKTDPFILTTTPHVYFVGNQPQFASELITGDEGQQVRLVLIPKFTETGQFVLINPSTLEVKLIQLEC